MIRTVSCLLLLLSTHAFAATPVNVNTADAKTIAQSLDGVGLAKAQAIVDLRTAQGPFASPNDLLQVKGISAKTLERNRDAIQLGEKIPGKRAPKATKSATNTH